MVMSILLQIVDAGTAVADTINQAGQQLAQQPIVKQVDELSLWTLALKGGWIMLPIALLSVIAVFIFVDRFIATNKAAKSDDAFMGNIRSFIHEGKIDNALALCRGNERPLARMIEKGILRIGKPLNDIGAAIETVGKLEIAKLEKSVTFLSTIAGAAPMLGFLGTVTGMITAFYNMSKAGNNIDIGILSGGIYEAMVTTVAGLVVGILAYLFYNIIVARIEKIVFLLEARATEFIDLLNEPA